MAKLISWINNFLCVVHVAIEIGEEDRQSSEEDKTDGPGVFMERIDFLFI